jgi:hypothetical protein
LEPKNEFCQHFSPKNLANPFTVQISNHISARLFPDCRPVCLETAPLQKGLALFLNGKELIEEGMGFGVPIAKYKDKTYFSGSAKTRMLTNNNNCTLVKSFVLNTISRKRIGEGSYINDKLYHFLHRAFELGYLNFQGLTKASNRVMELRKTLKVYTDFIRVKPRGTAVFKYSIRPNEIQVTANFSLLELDQCKEIIVLNEQGASFFRKYTDSSGTILLDRKIGAWARIEADEASFSDLTQELTFTLRNESSASFIRGWEKTRGRFSWAGLAYSLSPKTSTFCYSLRFSFGNYS